MPKKTAFFDMDGTVTAPVFDLGDATTPGFFRSNWPEFCNKEQAAAYKDCVPVSQVIEYARKVKATGWDVKLLTVVMSEGEKPAKVAWRDANGLQDLFPEIIFVNDSREKVPYIVEYANRNGLALDGCMLVEDNYVTVLHAHDAGIQAVHVSHIAANVTQQLVHLY